eukprot:768019-Hanusia_phi.AAC.3
MELLENPRGTRKVPCYCEGRVTGYRMLTAGSSQEDSGGQRLGRITGCMILEFCDGLQEAGRLTEERRIVTFYRTPCCPCKIFMGCVPCMLGVFRRAARRSRDRAVEPRREYVFSLEPREFRGKIGVIQLSQLSKVD